jgi:hypothetical protein
LHYGWLLQLRLCTHLVHTTLSAIKDAALLVLPAATVIAAQLTATKLDNPFGRLGMTYLKDIKVCVDCTFYGTPHGQRDRCIHPKLTTVDLVTGNAEFPYCHAERRTQLPNHCGDKASLFVLNREAESDRLERLKELEEAMREAPTL